MFFYAGSRGRTDTVLPPPDFESGTSANSIIPAQGVFYHSRNELSMIKQKNAPGSSPGAKHVLYFFRQSRMEETQPAADGGVEQHPQKVDRVVDGVQVVVHRSQHPHRLHAGDREEYGDAV